MSALSQECATAETVTFKAPWQQDFVSVCVQRPVSKNHFLPQNAMALVDAISLGEVEDACSLAESLLACELEFSVCSDSALPNDNGKQLMLKPQSESTPSQKEFELWMPISAWEVIAQNRAAFNDFHIPAIDLNAQLNIASIELGTEDSARIAVGSTLLIPASFTGPWNCNFQVESIDRLVAGYIDVVSNAVVLTNSLPYKATPNSAIRSQNKNTVVDVYLDEHLEINPAELFNPKLNHEVLLKQTLEGAQCVCRINQSDTYKATVMVIGRGYGLHFQEGV